MNNYMDIKNYIFEGYIYRTFSIFKVNVTFRTLMEKEKVIITGYQSNFDTYFSFNKIIKLLSLSIIEINGEAIEENIESILEGFHINFIMILYNCYKQLFERLDKSIESFNNFLKEEDSKIRWISFKQGYKFSDDKLNNIQEYWIYHNTKQDENEQYDTNKNLSDYIISHITHASINPKSYIQRIQSQKASEEANTKFTVDLNGDLKDTFKKRENETEDECAKRVKENLLERMDGLDEHDKIVLNSEIEKLKTFLRAKKIKYERVLTPDQIKLQNKKSQNLKVGDRQKTIMDDEVVKEAIAKNPFVVNNIDYSEILNFKAFSGISILKRQEVFKEIMEEENTQEIYETKYKELQKLEDEKAKSQISEMDDHDRAVKAYEDRVRDDVKKKEKDNIILNSDSKNIKLKDLIKNKGVDAKNIRIKDLQEME